MGDELPGLKVIEETFFESALSDRDRAEVGRLLDRIAALHTQAGKLRAAVRAADAALSTEFRSDDEVQAAIAAYDEARAKCGEVT